jgi:hypothetical protein
VRTLRVLLVKSPDVWAFGQAVDENGHRWFLSELFEATDEEKQTMAETLSVALAELLRKSNSEPDVDTLR